MAKRRFEIIYDAEVATHLAAIERKDHSLIKDTIEQQVGYEPDVETRNRKPLVKPSSLGEAWELRFGPDHRFRVFYKFDLEARQVFILAVGVKKGHRLFIGKEEFKL